MIRNLPPTNAAAAVPRHGGHYPAISGCGDSLATVGYGGSAGARTASGGKDWCMASDHNSRGHQGQPSTSEEGGYQGQDQLAQQLSELAPNLHREDTVQHTLMGIVRAVVDNVPGAQFAGISVVEARRKITTQAWSDEIVAVCDRAEYETGQGPCL